MLFFFKQKTAYEMRISDWSSDVCSSDLEQLEQRSHEGDNRKHGRAEDDSGDEVFATEIETRERVRREHADDQGEQRGRASDEDRKRDVEGKRVSVRVDPRGRRSNKKQNKRKTHIHNTRAQEIKRN